MPVSARSRALPALVGLPVLLFALITWQVVADGPLVGVDERLSGGVRAHLRQCGKRLEVWQGTVGGRRGG
ncbi:hypothetical protein ACWGJL_22870, partial [Streptomyces sp. NPDC054808]